MPSSFSRKLQYGFGVAFGLAFLAAMVAAGKKKAEPEKEPEPSPLKSILSMTYVQFLMWGGSGALEVSLFGYVFHLAATKVRPMNDARVAKGEPHMYWLEAIFRVLMLAFSGGTCIPIVLGMRPFPFANDAAVFLTALAFWLVHYFPHDIVYTAYKENQALKGLFWFLFEVMRCNVIIVWLKKAHIAIPPWGGGKYYPVAICGPIMAGGFAGCFGGFVHNGVLKNIEAGLAWLIQSSFAVTIFYHLCIFDPNVKPMALSVMNSVFGASESDGSYEQLIHVICVIFLVVMAQIQFFIKSTFNPFTPLQDLAYKVLMVPNPKLAKVKKN